LRVESRRRYLEQPLDSFLEDVASAELLPGAGYVAAVGVAMAAGLVAMGARLSAGSWPEARALAAQAEKLRDRATPLAEMNAEAYEYAVAALRGKKAAGSAGASSRDDQLAGALERAAWIPLKICEAASDVAALAASVAERGEPALRADLIVAALIAHASAQAAATLIEVNLTTTAGDERLEEARNQVGAAAIALERARAVLA
jgi:formiminotetrahydrofolate cyclodeaminase